MKIINGHGTIVNGKYIASELDKKESIKLAKELEKQVKEIIKAKFGEFRQDKEYKVKYSKYLQDASGSLWTPSIEIDSPNFKTNNQAFIHIQSGNNSSGYNNNEFKRHFNISFELKGSVRYKYQKHWENDSTIIKKYILADNMDEAINEFKFWINCQYDNFFTGRMLQNLPYNR